MLALNGWKKIGKRDDASERRELLTKPAARLSVVHYASIFSNVSERQKH